jgi:hypothetical protein
MEKRTTEGYSNLHAGSRPSAPSSDFITRAPTQRQKLILFLRERGERGGTNTQLIALGLYRYSSRIHECKTANYVIESVRETEGRWRYFLRHEPAEELPPYVFQQTGHSEQDQPKVLVGVTPSLFVGVGRD